MSSVGTSSDEEAQRLEDQRTDWTRRILVIAFVASTVTLVLYHMVVAKAGLSTALYLIIQIVTTIGYGDVTPSSDLHRVLVAFYVILALVVLANILNSVVAMLIAREEEILQSVMEQAGTVDHAQVRDDRLSGKKHQFMKSTFLFLSYIAFGTIFYGTYEACSCGYGSTAIDGCDSSTYETCSNTKGNAGQVKDYVEAFYFSVITLTTVGFGDFTPMTVVGRYVGIFWMITGVAITANWVGQLTTLFLEHTEHAKKKKRHQANPLMDYDEMIFGQLDYDKDDCLSRAEHHLYMLQKHHMLNPAIFAMLDKHFDACDEKQAGLVTLEQIRNRPNLSQS